MANKAGGIEQLGAVISHAEPCCLCDMARELNESSPSNGKNPFSSKSLDLLMGVAGSTTSLVATVMVESDDQIPIPGDLFPPAGREAGPATPPPRPVLTTC